MLDNEEPRLRPAYLAGRLQALEALLLAACSELPERAMHHIARAADDIRREAEANRERSDIWRDRADGMWEVAVQLDEALSCQIEELGEGARVRTVQPAPIHPDEQLFPDKGW
ncbi:hypothetical protein [Allomesorhizobium alhagi]|uniref:Uncharacterized protein n=1 Tax=Mesorhizobium alhagi CCNWXJ12-2 TaxID=1107882 RepID=H0HQX7_9HYPH|nr:hypothetical protein [Mesorhizobium alhagi]EHK56839.1 hypothetical protein MAXJ12_12797 [Mesorhizobium alhagi CCNWXJ12-2]